MQIGSSDFSFHGAQQRTGHMANFLRILLILQRVLESVDAVAGSGSVGAGRGAPISFICITCVGLHNIRRPIIRLSADLAEGFEGFCAVAGEFFHGFVLDAEVGGEDVLLHKFALISHEIRTLRNISFCRNWRLRWRLE